MIKHMGTLDSDEIVGRYLDAVAKYAVVTSSRTPILRRAWRWLCRIFS